MGYLRANQGWGYSGSFLSSWLDLSPANLLYWEDFLRSARSRRSLFSRRQSALGWLLGGFRVWKLNRKYPGEKPPPFFLTTKGYCLATLKPTHHLLIIPNIPVWKGALYEDPMACSVPPSQELLTHLSHDF